MTQWAGSLHEEVFQRNKIGFKMDLIAHLDQGLG